MTKPCAVDSCPKMMHAKGMCSNHYQIAKRNNPRLPAEERFWIAVEKTDSCWLWVRGLDQDGYGAFSVNDSSVKAHRFAYELLCAPIPEQMTIDHLCCVRKCVNPEHMEVVTVSENLRRRWRRWREAQVAA